MIVGRGVDVFSGGSATVSAGAGVEGDPAFDSAPGSIQPEQDTSRAAGKRILRLREVFLNSIGGILSIPLNYNKFRLSPCDWNISQQPLF